MASSVFERLQRTVTLPTPNGVALKLMHIVDREETTLADVAAVVSSDPSIASRLLKLVNSPLAGLERKTASINQAVTLLGFTTVRNVSLGFSLVSQHQSGACRAFDYDDFWSECVARAVAARHITQQVGEFSPEETFTCGLLCQVGRLALATAFPESYNELLSARGGADLAALERQAFEIDHNALGSELMREWYLPSIFCEAVAQQGRPSQAEAGSRAQLIDRILAFSAVVTRTLTASLITRETLSQLTVEANRLGITPEILEPVFADIAAEWVGIGALFEVATHSVPSLSYLYGLAR